jgi:hypothetical protein
MSFFERVKADIDTIGGDVPTVGTFGQLITAYEVRDIANKWEYEVYDNQYDMLPAELTGDGVQSFDNGMLVASSATTGTAILKSRNVTRYRTGNSGFAWFTALFNSGTGIASTGLISDNGDEIIIRENNGTIQFGYKRLGTEITFVNSSNFNGDADVNSITWSNLNIFQIRYGYLGTTDFEIFIKQNGKTKLLHKIVLAGTLTGVHVRFPQFRQFIEAENGATVKAGSWASGTFSNVLETRGQDPSAKNFFYKTERTISPTGTPQPIVAYRSKTNYNGFTHSVLAKLLVARIATTSEGLYEFGFVFNPTTITGGSFADADSLSSVIEVNEGITGFTGGDERFAVPIAIPSQGTGVQSLNEDFERLGAFLSRGSSVVITIRSILGTDTGTQTINFNWQELF